MTRRRASVKHRATITGMSDTSRLAALALVLGGCGLIDANIFDTTITLSTQTYKQEFSTGNGMVPKVSCTAQTAMVCSAVSAQGVVGRCDAAAGECYADASVTLPYPVDLSKDMAFQSGIGQKAVQAVRAIKLAYTIPQNTLTFNMPPIRLYVGPQGSAAVTDTGVVAIGTIDALAKGQTLTTPKVIEVPDNSPARTLLVNAVTSPKTPIVFLLAATPSIRGGDDAPAGLIQVNVTPSLVVGLPR